ncbi:hypothetical protein [Bathymodiolus japonicus methanotrophic gill symbiont]|uniref:hypothetical protein n=1 Tax=Bathymodiolus japonicus methanotrophic gill symbiont TaxID=113269 RepID=UPI001C8DA894|nr:hypothetical protein [Bathymodiolus japonicus methanotrophic gill symbiont]
MSYYFSNKAKTILTRGEAEQVHHINRDILQTRGKPARQVATEVNEFLQGEIVYSDGWVVDKPWLIELYTAAGIGHSFPISALEYILTEPQMALWHETKNRVIKLKFPNNYLW